MICITYCSQTGMLSIGVLEPERSCMITQDRNGEQPELAHRGGERPEHDAERRDREGIERSARQEERQRAGDRYLKPPLHHDRERQPGCDQDDETVRDDLRQHDLGLTTGMTSRCSIVPCSRSRISAAPVRITVSIVTLLITCITEVNQAESGSD